MKYHLAIIGGGLAGLSLSIDLKKKGYDVIVIEKGSYPRHKVCGEYISMESYRYLKTICPALAWLRLPHITNFKLSSTGKAEFKTTLDLGGFGISRFLLEEMLFNEAQSAGVEFMLHSKALDIHKDVENEWSIINTNGGIVKALLVCNSTGRKSNFETKDKNSSKTETNYVGVKYHIKLKRDADLIEIHNFPGGYCGISNIEDNKSCLCYIVNSKKLNSVHNNIPELERTILFRNRNLENIFANAEFLFAEPITISGINFNIKQPVSETSFFLGDSAGSIAPITGNGMSMALRSASHFAEMVDSYFSTSISKKQLTEKYHGFWKNEFSTRIKLSRYFQKLTEFPTLTNLCIQIFKPMPFIAKKLISQTHGKPF